MSVSISVIVPVFNCEQYIDLCLKSLVSQTYSNIEIIVIDDGSTDKTSIIVNQYGDAFSNVYVFHRSNEGVSAARNFGLSKAKGEYIGFVDSDDYVDVRMYAAMYKSIKLYKTDWVECGYYKVFNNELMCKYTPQNIVTKNYGKDFTEFCLTHIMQEPVIWNKLFRRSIILDNNLKFAFGASEDMVFCMEYAICSKTLTCLDDVFYYYVQRKNSIMHTPYKDMYVLETWLEQFLKRIYPNKMYEKQAGALIYKYIFAKILVGILFSECTARCSIAEFCLILKKIISWEGFFDFCDFILLDKLILLNEKHIVSKRVLYLLKTIAFFSKLHIPTIAAFHMWLFSRINQIRRQRLFGRWQEETR